MTHKARIATRLILAGCVALPFLSACGLRGGLARPAPIIKSLDPAPPAEPEKEEAKIAAPVAKVVQRPRINEFGGEIPEAAPTETVQSTPLEDPVGPSGI